MHCPSVVHGCCSPVVSTGHAPLVAPWRSCFFSCRLPTLMVCPLRQRVTFFLWRCLAAVSAAPSSPRPETQGGQEAAKAAPRRRTSKRTGQIVECLAFHGHSSL